LKLKNKTIGFCLTGSFYTLKNTIFQMKELIKEEANIIPIMSYMAYKENTKCGKVKEDFVKEIEYITSNSIINTIEDAELLGRKNITDIMIIAPCSGSTIAKLSYGITDTSVLMAVKSHMKYENPLVIAPATNDGLSRKCWKYRKVTK